MSNSSTEKKDRAVAAQAEKIVSLNTEMQNRILNSILETGKLPEASAADQRRADRERKAMIKKWVRNSTSLYAYLSLHFKTLEEAQEWYRRWRDEEDQYVFIPGSGQTLMSCRAMAYHCSNVLEGHLFDPNTEDGFTDYLNTKYGPTLYMGG